MDVRIDYGPIKPKVIRMHPRLEDISAFGMSNGVVLFYNQKTTKSYSLNCVRGHAPANEESKGEDIKFSVSDMSWDPHEENILVAVKNAGVCLISFQGISNTTQIIQTFNAKSRKICNLFWSDDKSGNFVTANEDQGTLTVWNAATP